MCIEAVKDCKDLYAEILDNCEDKELKRLSRCLNVDMCPSVSLSRCSFFLTYTTDLTIAFPSRLALTFCLVQGQRVLGTQNAAAGWRTAPTFGRPRPLSTHGLRTCTAVQFLHVRTHQTTDRPGRLRLTMNVLTKPMVECVYRCQP